MRILIYISFLLLLMISCKGKKHEVVETIGETEYYFDEKLSSISLNNDGSYFVGSETGDLFFFRENQRTAFDLGEDRIYKVEQDIAGAGDTTYWIGIRNSGLQKWAIKSHERPEKIKTYEINFKGDKYSPYDFLSLNSSIFIATSQGLYSLDKQANTGSLTLLYPSKEYLSKRDGTTFVVHNIAKVSDSLLVASSQGGLLWLNVNNNHVTVSLDGNHIEHVSVYRDTIYAICHEFLYLMDSKQEVIDKIKIGKEPKLYYQAQGVHYLVGKEELLLSNDLKEFFTVKLKRSIPTYSRNLIQPDTLNNFTYLVTENAIWRISNNIDVFRSNKAIKLSCFDNERIYYLSTLNELYVQDKDEDRAKWLYTFPSNEVIEWMDVKGGVLYSYNTDNEFLKTKISDSWVKNLLFASPKVLLKSEAKITAAYIKESKGELLAYLGIQDGLISIGENLRIDTIQELSKAYVTSMFSHDMADRLYVSTLNNGVFYINRDMQVQQIAETDRSLFIKDIITSNAHSSNLIILTNQQIKSEQPDDSIRVKGYQKLLYVNDSVFFGLPEFGIHKFKIAEEGIIDGDQSYRDIRFNASGSFSYKNNIVLVSNIGASILRVDDENNPEWIVFEKAIDIEIVKTTLLILLVLLLTISVTFIVTKRRNTGVSQQTKLKEELLKRIKDLIVYYNILDDTDNKEILELNNKIKSVEITYKKQKESNSLLDSYSQQIANINRQIALHLPKKLEEQVGEIRKTDAFEKDMLLRLSMEANRQDDAERIKDQIKSNDIWLQRRYQLFTVLNENIDKLKGSLEIEGVNLNLLSKIIAIKESENEKPLDDLLTEYELIRGDITRLESSDSFQLIANYLDEISQYINDKVYLDNGLSFMQLSVNKAKSYLHKHGSLETLRYIKPLGSQVKIMRILDEIRALSIKYKEINNRLIQENNSHVNKMFDKELASFIEDHTRNITKDILVSISNLYSSLLTIDESKAVIEILKLTNVEGQHARVLALLVSDLKIKRMLIPGMLGIYGNLNPVISRLINDRIKKNEDTLRKLLKSDKEKSVFLYYILQLLD